jgi:hypothetical protein
MNIDGGEQTSLYDLLASSAPPGAQRGETIETRTKETIDRDVEALLDEEVTVHSQQ